MMCLGQCNKCEYSYLYCLHFFFFDCQNLGKKETRIKLTQLAVLYSCHHRKFFVGASRYWPADVYLAIGWNWYMHGNGCFCT